MVVAAYTPAGASQANATSDSNGHYVLTVPAGSYRLLAYDNAGTYATLFAGDADSFETTADTAVSSDISNVNFALKRAGRITGSVSTAIGGTSGITVAAFNLNGSRRGFTTTTAFGAFTLILPPGTYKLVAYDDAGNLWPRFFPDKLTFADATTINVSAGQSVDASLRLDAAAHLIGSVLDAATNLPVASVSVLAYDANGVAVASTTTDRNGSFDLKTPPGSYRLVVADPANAYATAYFGGGSFATASVIDVIPGQNRANLQVKLQRAGRIAGRVTDLTGLPIVGTVAAYDSTGALQARTQTDQAGYYILLLPAGDYRIAAYDGLLAYATRFYLNQNVFRLATPVHVTPDQTVGAANFALERAARISGILKDADTNLPVLGATVGAYDADGDAVATSTTDVNGSYSLAVPAGSYRYAAFDSLLRYATAYDGGNSYETARVLVERSDSVERIDFSLRRGIHVGGTVRDKSGAPITGIEVSALDSNGNHLGAATSVNGSFELVLLPDQYRFLAIDPQSRFAAAATSTFTTISAGSPAPAINLVLSSRQRRRAVVH